MSWAATKNMDSEQGEQFWSVHCIYDRSSSRAPAGKSPMPPPRCLFGSPVLNVMKCYDLLPCPPRPHPPTPKGLLRFCLTGQSQVTFDGGPRSSREPGWGSSPGLSVTGKAFPMSLVLGRVLTSGCRKPQKEAGLHASLMGAACVSVVLHLLLPLGTSLTQDPPLRTCSTSHLSAWAVLSYIGCHAASLGPHGDTQHLTGSPHNHFSCRCYC